MLSYLLKMFFSVMLCRTLLFISIFLYILLFVLLHIMLKTFTCLKFTFVIVLAFFIKLFVSFFSHIWPIVICGPKYFTSLPNCFRHLNVQCFYFFVLWIWIVSWLYFPGILCALHNSPQNIYSTWIFHPYSHCQTRTLVSHFHSSRFKIIIEVSLFVL